MTDPTAPTLDGAAFRTAEGVEDWRVTQLGPQAVYRCDGLEAAARFATRVAVAARASDRAPDLDLRAGSVAVQILERGNERIAPGDLELARAVQVIAREERLVPEPWRIRSIQVAVAHAAGVDVRPFWRAVLGYEASSDWDATDPDRRGPHVWFHEIEHGRPGRGRTHLDVYVPVDQAERIVAEALAAGGRIADDSNAPDWWTLASPDNHGVDVAPWPDRGRS